MNRISEYRIVNIPRPIYSVTLGLPSGILRTKADLFEFFNGVCLVLYYFGLDSYRFISILK